MTIVSNYVPSSFFGTFSLFFIPMYLARMECGNENSTGAATLK